MNKIHNGGRCSDQLDLWRRHGPACVDIPSKAIDAPCADDAGRNSKLDKVCQPGAPESVLSQGRLRDCSQHQWTTTLYRSPARHAFRGNDLCPAKWTGSYQHSTEDGLTTSKFWSRGRRARHGQPDQPPLRPCRTHGTAHHHYHQTDFPYTSPNKTYIENVCSESITNGKWTNLCGESYNLMKVRFNSI